MGGSLHAAASQRIGASPSGRTTTRRGPEAAASAGEARARLEKTLPALRKCDWPLVLGDMLRVQVTIDPHGSVASVELPADHRGSEFGACVEAAVKTAPMRPFLGAALVVEFRINVSPPVYPDLVPVD